MIYVSWPVSTEVGTLFSRVTCDLYRTYSQSNDNSGSHTFELGNILHKNLILNEGHKIKPAQKLTLGTKIGTKCG